MMWTVEQGGPASENRDHRRGDRNMKATTEKRPTKKQIAAVKRWWKAGKNVWEISQLTKLPEQTILEIV